MTHDKQMFCRGKRKVQEHENLIKTVLQKHDSIVRFDPHQKAHTRPRLARVSISSGKKSSIESFSLLLFDEGSEKTCGAALIINQWRRPGGWENQLWKSDFV